MPTFIKHYINQTIKIGSDGWWELLDSSGNIIIRAYGDGTLVIPSLGVGSGSGFGGVGDNVKNYGARGDGVTDDTAAIQDAIRNGSTQIVYFPAGVYKVSSTLNFLGGRTYIFAAGAKIKYTGNSYAVSISSQKQIVWLGGEIDLTSAGSTAVGLFINGLWESSFVNLQVTLADSGGQYGVWIRPNDDWGSYSLDFINPRIRGGGEVLFRVFKEEWEVSSVTHLNIQGGWVSGSATYAFHLENLLDSRIENTIVGASDTAIYVNKCSHLILSPGEVEGNPARGIYFGSSDNHDIWIVLASRTNGLIVDETNYKPNYLDSAKGIRLFPSTSDQNYYVHLEPRYDYNNSFNLKVKGGSSERNLLSFGDVSGLKIFDGLMNLTPAGNVGIGTSAPWEKLSIEGNVLTRGGDGTGFRILSDSTNTLYGIGLWGNRLEFFRNEGGNWNWAMFTSEGGKWKFGGYVDKWDALLQVDGDVLIKGGSGDIVRNYLFEVKGPIKVSGIRNTLLRNDLVSKTGVLIPFYRYPWASGAWDSVFEDLLDILQKYHEVPVFVVINPSNGPGSVEDGVWRRAIKKLHGAGAVVLGYVSSSYATRNIDEVKADIDAWRSLYPEVDGLFVDEMTNDDDQGHRNYYIEVTRYAHKKGFYPVVGNPGAGVPGNYFTQDTADIIVIWETSSYPDEATLKGGDWEDSYREIPVWRRAALVHSQSSLSYSNIEVIRKYVGLLYVTSGSMPNPWGTVPSYLENILSYLARNGTDVTSAGYDLVVGTRTAHNLRFITNNVERVVVTPSGNVGIGTTTPGAKLDVIGTAQFLSGNFRLDNSWNPNPTFNGKTFTTVATIKTPDTGYNSISIHNGPYQTALVIDGPIMSLEEGAYFAGNVGIGTTAPTQKLTVAGNIGIQFGANAFIGTLDNYALSIRTNNIDRVYITDDGRVGIGTAMPLNKLDVRGFIRVAGPLTDSYSASALRLSATDSNNSWYVAYRGSLSGEQGNLSFLYSDGNNWVSLLSLTPSGNVGIGTTAPTQKLTVAGNIGIQFGANAFIGTLDNYALSIRTNNIDRVYITDDGRVGIGTTTPGYKLEVNGGVRFSYYKGQLQVEDIDASNEWGRLIIDVDDDGGWDRVKFWGMRGVTEWKWGTYNYTYEGMYLKVGWGVDPTLLQLKDVSSGAVKVQLHTDGVSYFVGGSVGIGTTTPGAKLDVVRDVRVQGWDAVYKSLDTGDGVNRTFHLIGTYHGWDAAAIYIPGYNYYNPADGDVNQSYAQRVHFGRPERMTIDLGSGNVGIGTTAPADKLHIYNGYLRIDSPGLGWGTNQRIVSFGPLSFQPDTDNSGDPYIYFLNPAGSATVFINTNSGNVGIGTTNPNLPLHIRRFANNDTEQSHTGIALTNRGSGGIEKTWTIYTAAVGGGWGVTPNAFEIWEYPETAPRFTIKPGGNVGIGTTTPGYKLDVYAPADTWKARFGGPDGYIVIGPANEGWAHIYTDRANFIFNTDVWSIPGGFSSYSTADLRFLTNGTERMRIVNANGNVGIGTTTPNYKLDVNGDIRCFGDLLSNKTGVVNIGTLNNQAVQIITNNTARVIIPTSGYVLFKLPVRMSEGMYVDEEKRGNIEVLNQDVIHYWFSYSEGDIEGALGFGSWDWEGLSGKIYKFANSKQVIVLLNGQVLTEGRINDNDFSIINGDYVFVNAINSPVENGKALVLAEEPQPTDIVKVIGFFSVYEY